MTTAEQRIAAIVRQVLAVAAIVMGALTQALQGIHLPTALSAVLAAGGLILLNIEHYLSDPSTGTPTTTTTVPVPTPVVAPVAPVAPAPAPAAPVAPVVAPVVPPAV